MRRYLIIVATLAVIGVNAAATLVPINGMATGQLSDLYPTGFTPAGWVFSIWSLIYLGLVSYGIYAALPAGANNARLRSIELPYLVSALANICWIFLWHYRQIGASVVAMLVLLGSLVTIYMQLRRQPATSRVQRVLVDGTFSVYVGWITTATFANLGAWFFDLRQWPLGHTMDEWAIITVVLAGAIYVAVGIWTADWVYTSVFVWAALGIVYRGSGITEAVAIAAGTGAAGVGLVTALSVLRSLFGERRTAMA